MLRNLRFILRYVLAAARKAIKPLSTKPALAVCLLALLALSACTSFQGVATAQNEKPKNIANNGVNQQDILTYLNQSIGWYRHQTVEEQLATEPGDVLFVNQNHELADQIIRLSFDFARKQAEVLAKTSEPQPQEQGATPNGHLVAAAAKADDQVNRTQAELDNLHRRLETATGKKREMLESVIAETQSELQLAQTRRDVLRGMLDFMVGASSSGSGNAGLSSQIDELAKTVPALAMQGSTTATKTQTASSIGATKAEPSGILALITDLISLQKKIHTLDETIQLTDDLSKSSKGLRSPLSQELRQMVQQGDTLANLPELSDPAALAQQKAQLDALTAQFRQRSDSVLPLVKQRILVDLYKRSLNNWRTSVKNQYSTELKSLFIRLGLLFVVLAVVIGGSEIWRKAIIRYIRDPRRRYQLLLLRRIVLWFLIAVIIALSFATELGSLATFAGLLTAGVAVALQNVILSVAGYFFLIGKYGVRVGDRVQISNVTGEVVDIGLVRLHLMELDSEGASAQPTGRVVVFSNSVVFQPNSGLFKQIPGTNFVWHEITLTLAPDSDYQDVEDRLMKAVESVFADYRDRMEVQRKQLEKALAPNSGSNLRPQSRLRLTQSGLEVVIRYPVDLEHAVAIDDKIARKLLDAIEQPPKLKLVGSGTPNLQPLPMDAEPADRKR